MNNVVDILPRSWMRLPSGRRLDLLNPSPADWDDSDLAIRLSRTYRWCGESVGVVPLSVAQHSLTVLELRRQWSADALTPSALLMELLHDADEAYLGWDAPTPMKSVLGTPFKQISERLMNAVSTRYALPVWTEQGYVEHKRADRTAAASEAVHSVGWTEAEVRNLLLIQDEILLVDPLAQKYDCAPWMPWPSDVAAARFLDELSNLTAQRAAGPDRGLATSRRVFDIIS